MLLYKSMAGLHLESCRQFWSLHLIKNKVEWKEAQEKATRLMKNLVFTGGITWKALILCGGVYKNLHGKDRMKANHSHHKFIRVWNIFIKKKSTPL